MAKMGKYCKAYPIVRFREFSGWTEEAGNLRKEKGEVDGQQEEVARVLTDEDFLYLQESFAVTDGIFIDENIIFNEVSQEWIDFCKTSLKFELPVYGTVKANGSDVTETTAEVKS